MTEPSTDARAVLFDIDGTLVDSNYLHVDAWTRAFFTVGHPVDTWKTHRRIGMGSDQLLAELLGDDADELGERAKKLHGEEYAQRAAHLREFAGAADLVRAVAARRAKAVLATSAVPEELERLRAVLGIDDAVAEIVSAEDVEKAKPAPDLVEVALARAEVPAARAIFVGDSVWDVEAAGRAGVACVGLLSGGFGKAELEAAGAIAVYDDPAALLADLDGSPIGKLLG
jgi:HAD superfamily hydrolase (TIGR01509 family)